MLALSLVKIVGAVMLLLYAVRMVRTGFERFAGSGLRRAIAKASTNPLAGASTGMVVAVLLQSATAVAMLSAGFASSGFMTTAAGLAVLLGADLGSALVVQFLSFDLSWLIPLLLAVGVWLFLKFDSRSAKQIGRIMIGVALVLLSLQMIGESTEPLRTAQFMPTVASYLAGDNVTALILGALLAFLVHSSVAAVLMIVAFVGKAGFTLDAALPLVLGANIGAGLVAVWLTRAMDAKARLLPIGNLIFRTGGALVALATLNFIPDLWVHVPGYPGQKLVAMHVLFNLFLAVLCMPLVRPLGWLLDGTLKDKPSADEGGVPLAPKSALDTRVIDVPRLAIASAIRELLRMGEVVEAMARPAIVMLERGEREDILKLQKSDSAVNQIHSDIKFYIAEVSRGELSQADAERCMELISFAVNLERAGDLVSKNIYGLALELNERKVRFSDEGLRELSDMHDRVLANIQLSLNVLVSGDVESARELIAEKDLMRRLEREYHALHLERLTSGTQASIESSNAHLEVIRSLKDINALFAAVAVPILAEQGQLRNTRLVPAE